MGGKVDRVCVVDHALNVADKGGYGVRVADPPAPEELAVVVKLKSTVVAALKSVDALQPPAVHSPS